MNFCTKCASYYQTPGTCNCFAPPQTVISPAPTIAPYPWYPPQPTVIPGNPISPTITWGSASTIGSSVDAANVKGLFSYTSNAAQSPFGDSTKWREIS